jgi:hypothetical protein
MHYDKDAICTDDFKKFKNVFPVMF